MSYFRICPICGAHLDPGEKCDCVEEKAAKAYKEQQEQQKPEKAERKNIHGYAL